jgi:hypothetical protein
MNPSDLIRQRLYNQHLIRPDFATPGEVVRWFGAVQAQDLAGSRYAIGLRMPAASEAAVEAAVSDRSIVRTWPMRATIHYVPGEDAHWMLKLLAQRQNVRYLGVYRKAGLTDEIIVRAGELLTEALQGGKKLRRDELYAVLEADGIIPFGEQRGLHLLGYWAREGLICLGPRRRKQPTFTLLDEWIPNPRRLEGDEALALLARRYFASHGPASEQDFAWWSGLSLAEVRRGLKAIEADCEQTSVDGRTYWTATPTAPSTPMPATDGPAAFLLPPYDEFTVAYKERSAFLDPTRALAAQGYGIGPSILLDGRIAGTWKRTLQKDAVLVKLNLFATPGEEQHAALVKAVEAYGRFIGLPAVISM